MEARTAKSNLPFSINLSPLPYRPQLIHSSLQPNRPPDPRCSKIHIEDATLQTILAQPLGILHKHNSYRSVHVCE